MSISSDSILAYGIDFGDLEETETALPWVDEEGDVMFETWYAEKFLGIKLHDPARPHEHYKETVARIPCELIIHDSFDYPQWMLIPRDSGLKAYRGGPKPVTPEFLARPEQEGWDALLIAEFEKIGGSRLVNAAADPTRFRPQWWLTSLYG